MSPYAYLAYYIRFWRKNC